MCLGQRGRLGCTLCYPFIMTMNVSDSGGDGCTDACRLKPRLCLQQLCAGFCTRACDLNAPFCNHIMDAPGALPSVCCRRCPRSLQGPHLSASSLSLCSLSEMCHRCVPGGACMAIVGQPIRGVGALPNSKEQCLDVRQYKCTRRPSEQCHQSALSAAPTEHFYMSTQLFFQISRSPPGVRGRQISQAGTASRECMYGMC